MCKKENAFYIPSHQKQIRLGLRKLKVSKQFGYELDEKQRKFVKIPYPSDSKCK